MPTIVKEPPFIHFIEGPIKIQLTPLEARYLGKSLVQAADEMNKSLSVTKPPPKP